ncbi:MAG: iron-sulfur cluster repair di-iron protein [Chitinophagaceae bacterium]
MNLLMKKSLAQIVKDDHRAALVFEKYNLDFCCKGKRSLQQACDDGKLPASEITAALERIRIENPHNSMFNYELFSLKQLVNYILSTHHDYVKRELPQILSWLQRVVNKHGEHHPEMVKVMALFEAMNEEMTEHMNKEELILFPRIIAVEESSLLSQANQLNNTYLTAPIEMMEQEHDHAGNLLAEIRMLTNNYTLPEDGCTTYRLVINSLQAFEKDLHQHVHLENNVLFPRALELFTGAANSKLN